MNELDENKQDELACTDPEGIGTPEWGQYDGAFERIWAFAPAFFYILALSSLMVGLYVTCNAAFQGRYPEACAFACVGVGTLVALTLAGVICEALRREREEGSSDGEED